MIIAHYSQILNQWDKARWPNFSPSEYNLHCPCCGEFWYDPESFDSLQHVRSKIQRGSIVGTVLRDDEMIIPDGSTIIQPGDQMIVITYTKNVPRLRKLFKAR